MTDIDVVDILYLHLPTHHVAESRSVALPVAVVAAGSARLIRAIERRLEDLDIRRNTYRLIGATTNYRDRGEHCQHARHTHYSLL
jgi:hypothetical protein